MTTSKLRYALTTGAPAALIVLACTAVAPAATSPLRHLVYTFTYETRGQGARLNGPRTADQSYNPDLDDQGSITVDVLREAPDRGLVVAVSEQAHYRSAPPSTCAVYGDTTVACDASRPTNPEEYAVLRFLGPTFFGSKPHWSISQTGKGTTVQADYTVAGSANGTAQIEEVRQVSSTAPYPTTFAIKTKVEYDPQRLLPIAVDETSTEYRHVSVVGVTVIVSHTTLTIASDSMAAH
jgi:hypothetical protein